jgi:NDP-sugar pyrophosphorylase family protein
MVTRNIGIFAAGRGVRLFGDEGGCKALYEVADRPLISFILDAAANSGVQHVALIYDEADNDLAEYVSNDSRFESVRLTPQSSNSTLLPVRTLIDYFSHSDFFLSTCDVVCPPDCLVQFDSFVESQNKERPLICFMATSIANDSSPIWIRTEGEGDIIEYGKRILPTGVAFASVRWCSKGTAEALRALESRDVYTDTELMSAIISDREVNATMMLVNDVMDVDTSDDSMAAAELIRSWEGRISV